MSRGRDPLDFAEASCRHRTDFRPRARKRVEQAAARAVAHLERWFDRPDATELRQALADLEAAVNL